MIILGLDPSTKMGAVALLSTPETVSTYHATTLNSSKERGIKRLEKIHDMSRDIVNKVEPKIIVIEGYGFAGTRATTMGEIGGIVRYAIRHRAITIEVPPTSLKKFVTGKGQAKKDKMMLEVYKRWGFEGTDDECDAYGLARFASCILGHTTMPKSNTEAVNTWIKAHPKAHARIQKLTQ